MREQYIIISETAMNTIMEAITRVSEEKKSLEPITDDSTEEEIMRLLELSQKEELLKRQLRKMMREIGVNKAKVNLIKAKAFINKLFDDLGEFSKKIIAIITLCKLIWDGIKIIIKIIDREPKKALLLF